MLFSEVGVSSRSMPFLAHNVKLSALKKQVIMIYEKYIHKAFLLA